MRIGIITCEILRKEIRAVIKKSGVKELYFVLPETTNSVITLQHQRVIDRFAHPLRGDGAVIKERALEKIKKEMTNRSLRDAAIISVLELRMHDYPDRLLAEIEKGINALSPVVDCVLLGYGLCGISAPALERVISEAPIPVFIPRHTDGTILNNCIEIALGREEVQSLLREEVGTFFMTPVGAELIKEPQVILESSINVMAGRMNRHTAADTPRIIKLMKNHYHRVVQIWYSEADVQDEEYRKTVENFARTFNLDIRLVKGSARLMCEALDATKLIE